MQTSKCSAFASHACIWLPVIRRKACPSNDTACPVHQHWFHYRDVKSNAVKAVTALHFKMMSKQTNETVGQAQQAHA